MLGDAMWTEHEFDKAARIAAEAKLKDYVEKLEAIAGLTRRASVDGKTHMINVSVEHVENQALFTAKYGGEGAKVVLNIEEMWRYALLANLATMIVPDFDVKGVRYVAYSHMQAADRLLMLGVLVPGRHVLSVRHIYKGTTGLLPVIEVRSDERKIIESPIHRPVLNVLREMDSPDKDHTLVIAWLFISTILNTPDDGKPSDGLAELAKRLAARSGRPEDYEAALEPLRPYVDGLDAFLARISRKDKAFLIGKMADYKGRIIGSRVIIYINNIDGMVIRANGIEINMVDVATAAANAFGGQNTWRGLAFPRIPPIEGPVIKAAAVIKAREQRLSELLKYGDSIKIGDVEIIPVKAGEIVVKITPENLSEIMNGFREGYYTHLRVIANRKKYDLLYQHSRFITRTRRGLLAVAEKLGIWPSENHVAFTINQLPVLLSVGLKAYAVRKVKKGEAMWIVRIGNIELKMTYAATHNFLQRRGKSGKIPVMIDGKPESLDLRKLVEGCEDCPERRVAEALNTAGIKWSVSSDAEYLFIYPPRR